MRRGSISLAELGRLTDRVVRQRATFAPRIGYKAVWCDQRVLYIKSSRRGRRRQTRLWLSAYVRDRKGTWWAIEQSSSNGQGRNVRGKFLSLVPRRKASSPSCSEWGWTPRGKFPFVLGTGVDAQRQIPLRDETGAAERCAGALASLSSGARGRLPDDGQMPPLKGVS